MGTRDSQGAWHRHHDVVKPWTRHLAWAGSCANLRRSRTYFSRSPSDQQGSWRPTIRGGYVIYYSERYVIGNELLQRRIVRHARLLGPNATKRYPNYRPYCLENGLSKLQQL